MINFGNLVSLSFKLIPKMVNQLVHLSIVFVEFSYLRVFFLQLFVFLSNSLS